MSDFSYVSSMKDSNSALRTVLKLFLCVVCKLSMVLIKDASVYTHSQSFPNILVFHSCLWYLSLRGKSSYFPVKLTFQSDLVFSC